MFFKKIVLFLCLLCVVAIFSSPPCCTMDDEFYDITTPRTQKNDEQSSSSSNSVVFDKEIQALFSDVDKVPVIIEDRNHPIRKNLNKLLHETQFTQKKLVKAEKDSLDTAIVVICKHGSGVEEQPLAYVSFLTELDKKFFIHHICKKTRAIQTILAILFTPAVVPMGSLVLDMSQYFLTPRILPVNGEGVWTILWGTYLFTAPTLAYQGWKFGEQIGNYFFDKNGFTPTPAKPDSLPHLLPEDRPIFNRISSSFGALTRASGLTLLYVRNVVLLFPNFASFLPSLALSRLKQAYDDNMSFATHRSPNNDQKTLIDFLTKSRNLANKNDEIVENIFDTMQKRIKEIEQKENKEAVLRKNLETELLAQNQDGCIEKVTLYINSELDGIPLSAELQKEISISIKGFIQKRKTDLSWKGLEEMGEDDNTLANTEDAIPNIKNPPKKAKKKTAKQKPDDAAGKFTSKNSQPLIKDILEYSQTILRKAKLNYAIERRNLLIRDLKKELPSYLSFYFDESKNNMFYGVVYKYFLEEINRRARQEEETALSDKGKEDLVVILRDSIDSAFALLLAQEVNKYIKSKNTDTEEVDESSLSKALKQSLSYRKISTVTTMEGTKKTPFILKGTDIQKNLYKCIKNQIPQPETREKKRPSSRSGKVENIDASLDKDISSMIARAFGRIDISLLSTMLYNRLQQELERIKIAEDLWIPIEDTIFSAFSVLFVKDKPLIAYRTLRKQVEEEEKKIAAAMEAENKRKKTIAQQETDKTEKFSPPTSPGEEAHPTQSGYFKIRMDDLVQIGNALQRVASISVDKLAKRLYLVTKRLPKEKAQKLAESIAIFAQGAAALPRMYVSYWVMRELLSYMTAHEAILFFGGFGAAFGDVALKTAQEWYLQQEAVSSWRNFGSRAGGAWPIRWLTSGISAVTSFFYTMPTGVLPFEVLSEMRHPYNLTRAVKFMMVAEGAPPEWLVSLHGQKEKWKDVINGGANLFIKCFGSRCCGHSTLWQKRVWLNQQFDKVIKLMPYLDEQTTAILLQTTQDAK